MKISLLGSGRVAFHLAKALLAQGHHIAQVYARDFEKTKNFLNRLNQRLVGLFMNFNHLI